MEGADGGGIGVDCSVGTIVWVRRRNGSWWPGRILGPEELSASHLMSPRSGTPVKLLGREDASVDWYNMEKSKRVKAFRCGEFDACIERAEASQDIFSRKREKYARREDAILHALELEKKQLEMTKRTIGMISHEIITKLPGTLGGQSSEFSPRADIYRRRAISMSGESQVLPQKAYLHCDEEDNVGPLHFQKGENFKGITSEEDAFAIPQMQALQDFGPQFVSSIRNSPHAFAWGRPGTPDELVALSSSGQGGCHAVASKKIPAARKKRSLSGMSEVSPSKRRDRRRPLVQVLQNSRKLSVSHSLLNDVNTGFQMEEENDNVAAMYDTKWSHDNYLQDDSRNPFDHLGVDSERILIVEPPFEMDCPVEANTFSGLIDPYECNTSEKDFLEPSMNEDESLTDTDQMLLQDPETSEIEMKCEYPAVQALEKFENSDNEVHDLYGMECFHPLEQVTATAAVVGVSKWHLKGKRKTRNLGKRTFDLFNGKWGLKNEGDVDFKNDTIPSGNGALGRGFDPKKEFTLASPEDELMDNDFGQLIVRDCELHVLPPKDHEISHGNLNDLDNYSHLPSSRWEADDLNRVQETYWGDGSYSLNDKSELRLVDVDLGVQAATHHGEHVPLVSLMSRLNGKAIVGHPLQIEVLEDGSAGILVSRGGGGGSSSYSHDEDGPAHQPVWRTGRRTAMQRVPRSSHPLDADEAEDHPYLNLENAVPLKNSRSTSYGPPSRSHKKKNVSGIPRTASGKFQKRPSKKASLSSLKTRTLSSVGTERRLESGSILGGLLEPGGAVTLATCVPAKVVFSRILEGVGRPSSAIRRQR